MSDIIDLQGRSIGTSSNKGKISQAQAGAVITSEIEIAIERWNVAAMQNVADDAKRAHLFKIDLQKFEYTQPVKDQTGHFGYAQLIITVKHQDKVTKIYDKGVVFTKSSDMENLNGYYPNMVIDCLGFLIASGLMYNLALTEVSQQEPKEPKHAKVVQPGADLKGQPRPRNTRRPHKGGK